MDGVADTTASRRQGLGAGLLILLLCLLPAVLGLRLMMEARGMADFHDEARAAEIMARTPPPPGMPSVEATRAWKEEMRALRTDKWPTYDRGRALVTLSLCLAGCWAAFRLWNPTGLRQVRGPATRARHLALLALAWLWVGVAFALHELEALDRFQNPVWADTPAPAMVMGFLLMLLTLPVPLLAAWLCLRRAALPAHLLIWRADRPWRSWLWSVAAGTGLLLMLAAIIDGVVNGDLMLPSFFTLAYLILSLRAALLAPKPGP
ncbi:MAG TPA: hypothetical protein VED40_06305 [Azospirillaceae bacterium]|nr:hypothetical protein [Azospirillaceae bacterium]